MQSKFTNLLQALARSAGSFLNFQIPLLQRTEIYLGSRFLFSVSAYKNMLMLLIIGWRQWP